MADVLMSSVGPMPLNIHSPSWKNLLLTSYITFPLHSLQAHTSLSFTEDNMPLIPEETD